jgi:hypothetical protein
MKWTRYLITASLLGLTALSSTFAAEGTSKCIGPIHAGLWMRLEQEFYGWNWEFGQTAHC